MKLNYTQFTDLLDIVIQDVKDHPYLRSGQSLFNNLVTIYPEWEIVRASNYDPFYDDNKILACLEAVVSKEAIAKWVKTIIKFKIKTNE